MLVPPPEWDSCPPLLGPHASARTALAHGMRLRPVIVDSVERAQVAEAIRVLIQTRGNIHDRILHIGPEHILDARGVLVEDLVARGRETRRRSIDHVD